MAKTLFDHLNAISKDQKPDYFRDLSEEDKKTWSNYMIHRFLSMNYDFVDLIAQYDRDCDDAVAREDYDKAEELAAIQENLRRVAALNPQPNAKAALEAFVADIGDLNDRIEELRATAHAKEA